MSGSGFAGVGHLNNMQPVGQSLEEQVGIMQICQVEAEVPPCVCMSFVISVAQNMVDTSGIAGISKHKRDDGRQARHAIPLDCEQVPEEARSQTPPSRPWPVDILAHACKMNVSNQDDLCFSLP